MDTFDQTQLFVRLRKILPKSPLDWTCQETIKFIQFANMSIYEAHFAKKQVDGKKMIKSYSAYNYEKFKDKTQVPSLLHYQKFLIWTHILKENYDKFLQSVNAHKHLFDHSKYSPQQQNQIISIKYSNSITLSPQTSQKNGQLSNQSSAQSSTANKIQGNKGVFEFPEDASSNLNNSGNLNLSSNSLSNQPQQPNQGQNDQFVLAQYTRNPNNEINQSNSQNFKQSVQSSTYNSTSNNSSQQLSQQSFQETNDIFKKITENFAQPEQLSLKLMEMIEESKGNKKFQPSKTRLFSRCIKTTERQKKKMIELIEKLSSEKCFLMWNTRMVHSLLQLISFNTLFPIVEQWGLDGFIIQLVLPLYSVRQIELAFECKHEDTEKIFWLSDIFNAIKYTEQYQFFSSSYKVDPLNISSLSSSGGLQDKSKDNILYQQIQNLMNNNNNNLNSSLILNIPPKKLSIDTLDSNDQSASQNLDKQYLNDMSSKKENWQHNSSNLTPNLKQKQEQPSFMISNQEANKGNRKGSEEFTLATTANHQSNQKPQQQQQVEEKNSNLSHVEIKESIDQDPASAQNIPGNPEFGESVFYPESIIQNSSQQKKRISINFNKKEKTSRESITLNSLQAKIQEIQTNQDSQFAESTILIETDNQMQNTFNVGLDINRCQSESIQYFNPPSNQTKNSMLQTIEEKDKSAESQSLADSMMNSTKMSSIPNVANKDKKFIESGVFAGTQTNQGKMQKNIVDVLGTSTYIQNSKQLQNQEQFQESVILTNSSCSNNYNSQPQNNKEDKIFSKTDNCVTPKNLQNVFADSVMLTSDQQMNDSNFPKSNPSLSYQKTQSITAAQLCSQGSMVSTPIQSGANNQISEFCDSVLIEPTQTHFGKGKTQNQEEQLQESIILPQNNMNNINNNQFQDSVTFPIQNNFQKNQIQKLQQQNQQKNNAQNKTNKIEDQFAESTLCNNNFNGQSQYINQFQESTLITPLSGNNNSNNNQNYNNTQMLRQVRGVSEFQESTLINPINFNKNDSKNQQPSNQFQESTLINPIQQNKTEQFQESTLINPKQTNKPTQQFFESQYLMNTQGGNERESVQLQESTIINPQPQKSNQSKQSFVQDRNFRQSIVRNVNGEIDFNKSVIFNNQNLYCQKAQNQNKQDNFQIEDVPSPAQTKSTASTELASNKQSFSHNQSFYLEDRQTQQFFKRPKSNKSQEYQILMNQLAKKTPSLIFNPFDFTPLKKSYCMRIRIKSPDGSIHIDHSVTTDGATFGRHENNIVNFPKENMISSYHAEIFFDNLQFYLRDKGSKQGTFIKMKEISLKKNMLIQLSVSSEIKILELDEEKGEIQIETKTIQKKSNYNRTLGEQQEIKFGRDKEKCDIPIKEQSISGIHAKIVYSQKKFIMYDQDSLNGIWLRMSQKQEVSEPFLITPDFSFRICLINIQVIKLSQPKMIQQ
ncbi:FHA domain protein (macronuclear) [Tetrahymena thermophila SB210]|uniref:FHA domain protein n=1 Tax=Tetrahymena thermophila (strain SB210) TaxID=312017 RepID=Q22B44_TETTS|nr:FHA domain protein [Tetrahymena thermophila SB210]EAR82511.2 FHA domain protein [Tetrahymena thermophila SB210]|eukprot:XP_001030174.2 FHA domain protein [Tetrahymena thermophila SB210]